MKISILAVFVAAAFSAGASQASGGYTVSLLSAAAEQSDVRRINDSGQAVGHIVNRGMDSAVVWNGGVENILGSGRAAGINNAGQMVGSYGGNAMLWNGGGGAPRNLSPASTGYDMAQAINNSGVVVGSVSANWDNGRATRWNGTVQTDLGTIGGNYSYATDINDSGVVVGASSNADYEHSADHATMWSGGKIIELDSMGGQFSYASAINGAGTVVGYAMTDNYDILPTFWNGAAITELVGLGGRGSRGAAYGINDAGLMVGVSVDSADRARATLWRDGVAIDLNSFMDAALVSEGWVLSSASDINNHGWIVGSATNSKTFQVTHGFMMSVSAVPEPGTYAMLLAGLGLMGFVARRQRRA